MRYYLLLFIFCFQIRVVAQNPETPTKPTICLDMIVKNESKVITRCIESILPLIDYWVIVDTGSTDGTQQIIKDFMKEKGIPGELHEKPWVNFAHNRNQALELAKNKADYVFFIDADEYLEYEPDFKFPYLDKDSYIISMKHGGSTYGKLQLAKNQLDWRWEGVLHEYVWSPQAKTSGTLEKVHNVYTTEGARSQDSQKYHKDAQILEAALKENPNNDRYLFYLAQSYRDAGENEKALEAYKKRIEKGNWDQEVFWSLLQVANIEKALGVSPETFLSSYYKAFYFRPSRAEPLYYISEYYRNKGDYENGYLIAKVGTKIPLSTDILFVDKWIYDYGLPLELSVNAYWTGKYEECQKISTDLLALQELPDYYRDIIKANLDFANKKLIEKIGDIPIKPNTFFQTSKTTIEKYLKPIEVTEFKSGVDLIDCVYVINLNERPNKWERMKTILEEKGINPNRYNAINGWKIDQDVSKELSGSYKNPLRGGELGCLLSHLSIYKDALARNFNHIWILEDDVVFFGDKNDVTDLIKKVTYIDPNWDIIYTDIDCRDDKGGYFLTWELYNRPDQKLLPGEYYRTRNFVSDGIMRIRNRYGTHSMIISKKGLEKLYNYFTHVYLHTAIDCDIHYIQGIREYSPNKEIVTNLRNDAISDTKSWSKLNSEIQQVGANDEK